MFKTKTLRYETECDLQMGDGEFVFYKLYEVKKWLCFTYYTRIHYGLQKEMITLCENLNKILGTQKKNVL